MKRIKWLTICLMVFLFSCKTEQEQQGPVEEKMAEQPRTLLTPENFALAESQMIFEKYVKDIAAATKTDGVGVFMHNRKAADPKDKTVVRINFDTQYSVAILDLDNQATLTMPETNGRYQSAWFITEAHYNPLAINKPGTYTITQEEMGSRYVMLVIRTQVNMTDPEDLAKVSA